jgi:ATP/maltotriose-dependent transcriptional regulator MalT
MADPPAARPSEVAASERDVLLATKLHIPAPRPEFVPRPRLARRLDEGLGRGLLLVCAPAGYGKTVLLADWTQSSQHPPAWLSLDEGDNDPARFWRHVVAALDRACPGIGEGVSPLLGPPAPQSFDGLVTALINELAAQPGERELLLILDDYHVIDAQLVHASVSFLLEHRPPRLSLVLATRSDPPLALARLRVRGQLAELRAADLRFTAGEAAALLQQAAAEPDRALPETALAALAARTEGWAAGLQLAALSLRGQPDVAGFVADFTGSHRYILDYLAEEVLERQPEQIRIFLLETCVLERLSGALCDAVTGRTGSQALLEQVERSGLFIMPLDQARGWWRYHHLFADLLRARLEQRPGRAAELHRSAAAWYEGHGLADEAIRHTVAAGELTQAARLIERHFDAVYNLRGHRATIQRWVSMLPDELVRSRPRLLLAQALLAATAGQAAGVEPLLGAAERAFAVAADEPFEPTAGPAASLLANVPALIALHRSDLAQSRGDAEAMAAFASRAMAECSKDERLLSSNAEGFLAGAEWLRGRLAAAEGAFTSSIAGWQAVGQLTTMAWGVHQLGQIQQARGRLDEAAATFQQMLETTAAPGRSPPPAAGAAYAGLAEVAYQRNELEIALAHVTDGIALCRQFLYTPPLAAGLVTLARIRQASGDPAGALDAIGQAVQAAPGPPGLLNPVLAQRARLLLAQGDVAAAGRWAEERGLDTRDALAYAKELEHLVLARLLLAQGHPGHALALLDRLHAAAHNQDRTRSLIEVGALRALALAAGGEDAAAVAALTEALNLAGPQNHVRVFTDEGPPMAALLSRLVAAQRSDQSAAGIPLGFLAQLLRSFDASRSQADPRRGTAAVPGLVEPLTARELEVLRLLAEGRSNQAIAGELVVTLDTVKKHVTHVLGKLGAVNRTEAVARARELSLIP